MSLPDHSRKFRVLVLAAVAFAAVAALLAGVVAAHGDRPQQNLILRLSDLPGSYINAYLREGQESKPLCEGLTDPEDTPPDLAAVVKRFHPSGCVAGYYRLFELPGEEETAAVVGTGVTRAATPREANAVWSVVPTILGRLVNDRPLREAKPAAKVGRVSRAFHYTASKRQLLIGRRLSFFVWRSRQTVAAVLVYSDSFAAGDRIAAQLARRQEAHIRDPTPYTEAERFDGEVPLDDPAVDLPIYWLGRHFRPGGGIPGADLSGSSFAGKPTPEREERLPNGEVLFTEGPSAPLRVDYGGVDLDTWPPSSWHVYSDSKTGRAITTWKCTKQRVVTLPQGTATIFGGYEKNFGRCPKRAPSAFTAWVEIGGVTVVVNAPFSVEEVGLGGDYASFPEMEAIVRGLKLRPKPVY